MLNEEIERIKKEFQEKAERLPLANLAVIEKWLDNIPTMIKPNIQNEKKPTIQNKYKPKFRRPKQQSEFCKKYIKHYGVDVNTSGNDYLREYAWWKNHNHKCRWEK